MAITLHQFEQIDGQMSALLHMGEFETCSDPRGYVRGENRLYDLLIDAFGKDYADDFASALECAAFVVTQALLGQLVVLDAEAA